MERDKEFWLYVLIDQKGNFVTVFSGHISDKIDFDTYGKNRL